MDKKKRKIILAVTGASGSLYAKLLLHKLSLITDKPAEIAVVLTDTARMIWLSETGEKYSPSGTEKEYSNKSFNVPFASGSSLFDSMIICPSSMGCMGRIANGISDDLITRAADVIMKERRKLIIVPRETPYNLIHLENMRTLTLAGAIICPATPSFYSNPASVDELVMTVVDRIIDLAGFENDSYRWMTNG